MLIPEELTKIFKSTLKHFMSFAHEWWRNDKRRPKRPYLTLGGKSLTVWWTPTVPYLKKICPVVNGKRQLSDPVWIVLWFCLFFYLQIIWQWQIWYMKFITQFKQVQNIFSPSPFTPVNGEGHKVFWHKVPWWSTGWGGTSLYWDKMTIFWIKSKSKKITPV